MLYDVKPIRATGSAMRDPLAHTRQNIEGPAVVRAQSRTVCDSGKRARVRAQLHILGDVMSSIVVHNRLHHSSLENAT